MRPAVVMATSSYPRFPGDLTGTFVEPIAHGVAACGYDVHLVAPWHPTVRRPAREGDVHFHFYRYAPIPALNVFGYAGALNADVSVRPLAYLAAPFALAAARRAVRSITRRSRAAVVHAHWVIPSGVAVTGATDVPTVISLHGSDVYVAERLAVARRAAAWAFARARWVTACSENLRTRAVAIGADATRSEVVPYGVDADRFAPDATRRRQTRAAHRLRPDDTVVFAVGRLVRKKGFEYLIDAVGQLAPRAPSLRLVLAGSGDLDDELRRRAGARGLGDRVRWLGAIPQPEVAAWLTAADIVAVPSVRDDAGNVDGLPNVVLEALASATPVVTTPAGGIAAVARDRDTALVVPERDADGLARAIAELAESPALRRTIGQAARRRMRAECTWAQVAERFVHAYERARGD